MHANQPRRKAPEGWRTPNGRLGSAPALWRFAVFALFAFQVTAAPAPKKEPREFLPAPFDQYFARRVAELSTADWQTEITSNNWLVVQARMRTQLQQMLGLDPWPERTPLKPVITGTVTGDGYLVEKLHFQSAPGLYVTANFYRPSVVTNPLPAILYVCGHAKMLTNGVSLGNKTGYQHHGIWFARHGYVCLVIDTIQLGEIQGYHHGTYNLNRWWWPARGYTPAGVEAWNGIRALDYLETRSEADRTRIGVTGRSGGGAYSWWIAALDDRIAAAVPTAGITTLKNHILDGAIEGHCDCMFMVNTERWDFDRVAALIAPRPLCIANTDKDDIFPLDGVMEIYNRTRLLYRKLGAEKNIGLQLAEGPHADTQPLNTGAFHWMDRFLQKADRMHLTDEPARKMLVPLDLKVFPELPKDECVTTVDEWFVPRAVQLTAPVNERNAAVPAVSSRTPTAGTAAFLPQGSNAALPRALEVLRRDCFRAWPGARGSGLHPRLPLSDASLPVAITNHPHDGCEFTSEPPFTFKLQFARGNGKAERVILQILNDETAKDTPAPNEVIAYFNPRGTGPTGWTNLSTNKQTQLRRRLLLLGESLESGQVWDIRQAIAALRSLPEFVQMPVTLRAQKIMAVNALYAAMFTTPTPPLDLHDLPASHKTGPIYLNILRHLDIPEARALCEQR